MSTDLLYYEQPLNERIRTLLRLESLFQQIHHHLEGSSSWDYRATLAGMLDVLGIISRSDIKSEMLKELERLSTNLTRIQQNPDVHQEKLDFVLRQLNDTAKYLHSVNGRIGCNLKNNDFLSSVRQRSTIPGGNCAFDLPAYHFWLQQPTDRKNSDVARWLEEVEILEKTSQLVAKLIRESAIPCKALAEKGFYQQAMDPNLSAQLIRVGLPMDSDYFPEISAGRHRFTIRLLKHSVESRPIQIEENVNFELSICSI